MSAQTQVRIIGGGPAGSAAALAALAEGARVTIYEKARAPRHKVCGEFLSPEIASVLERLRLLSKFETAQPARITRAVLHVGRAVKRFRLPEPAYSFSRLSLDELLLKEAIARGAILKNETVTLDAAASSHPTVIAHGRRDRAPAGNRVFGFKAHFTGPADDTVEMFFFRQGYAGLSRVEEGAINVCGLAPEASLRERGFDPECLFPDALRQRVRRLSRSYEWIITGPLVYRKDFPQTGGAYLAGDALGFVDPFTGSGILRALVTGAMAGKAAAQSAGAGGYTEHCRRMLSRQYNAAMFLRRLLETGVAEWLAPWAPGGLLYHLTRPSLPEYL